MTAVDPWDLIATERYAESGYPHELWRRLRREAPILRCEPGRDVSPFYAVTKYEDIVHVSKNPNQFLNAPRLAIFPGIVPPEGGGSPARHLLNMDPPDHGIFRRIASSRFTPRALRSLSGAIEKIARDVVRQAPGPGNAFDFVECVAAPFPLHVLAEILGVPEADWDRLFRWTNETIGSADPEYRQEGEDANATATRSRLELFQYFAALAEERRARPADDLASLIANSRPGDEPIPDFEMLSYFYLIVVAGNETTRNALSGGVMALIEHPEALARLRAEPQLIETAVEEILRWTTPVIQFTRTAVADCELRGVRIRARESLCLFYPSANRDEDIFEAPFEFRIDREPNRHLAFGIGEHFCLGANLARLELRVMLKTLLSSWDSLELTGAPDRLHSSFVGGIKRLPVRVD
jgi:cytochrome P450